MKDINILKEKAQKGRLLWLELVEKYNIGPIGDPEKDMKELMGE